MKMTELPDPVVQEFNGIHVVRDDLLPGGTKLRYIRPLFDQHDEVVYASSAQGGAQLALAYAARMANAGQALATKQAAIFVALRRVAHPRTIEAMEAGAKIVPIEPGHLTVVSARAKHYAAQRGAFYIEFGGESPEAIAAIESAARSVRERYGEFDEVWSAAGSGVLSRGLQAGFPDAKVFAVTCGVHHDAIGRARLFESGVPYGKDENRPAPFPACPTYERKAWQFCKRQHRPGARVLFWNVMGPSPTGAKV